jgi:hypothetical protein
MDRKNSKWSPKTTENGKTRELYQAIRTITNRNKTQEPNVKNKHGEIIQDKDSRMERWAEHFKEVLVRQSP